METLKNIYSRINNLIITGLPRAPNKDLRVKVMKIAEKLNVDLHEYDIYTMHRLTNRGEAPTIVKINNQDKTIKVIKEGRKYELNC